MTPRMQVVTVVLLVLSLVVIINMVRRRSLDLKYVLTWIGCDLALLVIVIFPRSMVWISEFLGIQSPINMVFFIGFLFSLIILFSLTVALSKVSGQVRELSQVVAMNEEKIASQSSKNNKEAIYD